MADGSDTPFYELFLNMLQEEFSYVVPPEFKFQPATHCSDYVMRTEDNAYIVHNEDGSGLIDFNKTIIVRERLTISMVDFCRSFMCRWKVGFQLHCLLLCRPNPYCW